MKNFKMPLIAILFLFCAIAGFSATNKANWGDSVYIDSNGVIYAGQGISLGGTTIENWGSSSSPWEVSGTTTLLTSAPTKFILTHSTGVANFTGFIAGSADVVLENGQILDGGTNNAFKFTENSDTFSLTASGNDWVLDSTDGGVIFTLTDATDGTVDIMTNNDSDDYIQVSTTTNQPLINFVGCNGKITAASGTIDFDNENVTTTGTLSSGATTVTSLIAGDETLSVATDDQFQFKSNDQHTTIEVLGYEAKDAVLLLDADQGDDNADSWFLKSIAADNDLHFLNHTTLRLTMSAAGNILTTGDITVAGTTPKIELGDEGDEDAVLVIKGQTNTFHVGFDTTDDLLNIGVGATPGTTCAIEIDASANTIISTSLKTPYQIVAATETLTENESMKLVVLNHATEFVTTLPDVAHSAGVTFRIVIGAAPVGASYTVVTEGGENKISGLAIVNGASVQAADEDTITFTASAAAVGDWVELTCDGVLWYVSGQGHAATAIVFTAT